MNTSKILASPTQKKLQKSIGNDRNLGRIEQALENLNSQAKTWNIVTISRIKGPLDAEILRQALDIIQLRHPRLNSRIVRFKNNLYFQTEGTAKIALRVVIKSDDEQWQEVVHEEINQEIDSSKCLLRAVLVHLQNNSHVHYLITTGHHAVGDGLSSIRLHSEILTYCQQIVDGDIMNPVSTLFPLPPIEELLPQQIQGLKGKINSILFFLQLAFQKVWHRPKTLGFEKYTPVAQRCCGLIHRKLDQELTQKFINCCRQENTTVNSALCAAMMLTVASKIIKNGSKNVKVNCLSYIDLRKYLEPKICDEHMAVLTSSFVGFHTIQTNKSFWELAREVRQNLENSIKRGDIFKMILIAKNLIDFYLTYPQQVVATTALSNVGRVNIPSLYGEFELEEISFVGSQALYAGMFITHASTFKGKLLLNFAFSHPGISRYEMESLVDRFMFYIVDICNLKLDPILKKF